MKERPILFSGAMVRAILNGTKSQTRRALKPQPALQDGCYFLDDGNGWETQERERWPCPHGQPGDRLWVRETWRSYDLDGTLDGAIKTLRYRASREEAMITWKPSIHMPRWASRITLEIVSVRVERVQDISEKDVEAEGIARASDGSWLAPLNGHPDFPYAHSSEAFCALWDSINAKRDGGKYAWNKSPWVWAIEFKRV